MISGILYDREDQERNRIRGTIEDLIARYSADDSRINVCDTDKKLIETVEQLELSDFSCAEAISDKQLSLVRMIRSRYPLMSLLLIVNAEQPPGEYIRPDIMAASLIMRPASDDEIARTLEEFLSSCLCRGDTNEDECLRVETREGVTRVPYDKIRYIEASLKKVNIRLLSEEYSYYATLDELEKALPENFIRCHRSYIVNRRWIRHFSVADNLLQLEGDLMVPVSRSHREEIREQVR